MTTKSKIQNLNQNVSFFSYSICFTLLYLLLTPNPVLAHRQSANHAKNGETISAEQKHLIENLTLQLSGLIGSFQNTSTNDKTELVTQITALAEERKQLLLEIAKQNPGEALRVALPKHLRQKLPDAIQSLVEQDTETEGELTILHVDHEDPSKSRYDFFLATPNGKRLKLHFANFPKGLLTGNTVRANGLALYSADQESNDSDASLLLNGEEDIVKLTVGGNTESSISSAESTAIAPNTFGEQQVAVLLINFTSLPQEPWTLEQAHNAVFNTASDFFLENSYGQTTLNGDVFGWITIDVNPTGCPATDISIQAKIAAGAQGIDLSQYGRIIYAFPDIGCSWSGLGTVGGSPSETWLDGTLLNDYVVTHEVGHNFGLFHSHAFECGIDTVGNSCLTAEYGDALDRMGNSNAGHFNAFQKTRLGWLDYPTSPAVVTANFTGSYQIEPLAANTPGAKAIRFLRDSDPITGQNRWYFLEYRQAIGYDSFLSTSRYGPSVTNGLVFHLGIDGDPNSSNLLDITPNSHEIDWDDMALPVGNSYEDTASGAIVTLDQIDANGAVISVDFGQPQCVRQNPSIIVSPSQGPWVQPGTAVAFDLTVTNNDNDACPNATLNLAATVPSGWQSSIANPTVTLTPGANAVTTFTVTSALTAPDGFYPLEVSAVQQNNPSYWSSVTATYVVSSVNQAPVAVDDSGSTTKATPITLNVLDNDSDPDGDSLELIDVTQPASGSVTIEANGTLTYQPALDFTGNASFQYTISDATSNASAMVTVNVKKGGGGAKDGGGGGGGKGSGRNK